MEITEKVCLITGASGGIGEITAREIARQGMQVVIVSRNEQRCQAATERIRIETSNPSVDYLVADLSSQAQVRQLAQGFREKYPRLDVLVNNAGGFYMKRLETVDGIELTWALNHLNYFLLTDLLLDMLKTSAPARVVNVSSNAHLSGGINFDDLEGKRFYFGWLAYAQSKLANVLFTFELARRLEESGVTANVLHPGFVATQFGHNNNGLPGIFIRLAYRFGISPEEGARTSTYLATSPEVEGVSGTYFVNCKPKQAAKVAYDETLARRLWLVSQQMCGIVQAKA
jgi:retinol dehydrogenase-12